MSCDQLNSVKQCPVARAAAINRHPVQDGYYCSIEKRNINDRHCHCAFNRVRGPDRAMQCACERLGMGRCGCRLSDRHDDPLSRAAQRLALGRGLAGFQRRCRYSQSHSAAPPFGQRSAIRLV